MDEEWEDKGSEGDASEGEEEEERVSCYCCTTSFLKYFAPVLYVFVLFVINFGTTEADK